MMPSEENAIRSPASARSARHARHHSALAAQRQQIIDLVRPLALRLFCPACDRPHIDRHEWRTRMHHAHRCEHCSHEWDVGVYSIGVAPSGDESISEDVLAATSSPTSRPPSPLTFSTGLQRLAPRIWDSGMGPSGTCHRSFSPSELYVHGAGRV